MAFHCWSPSHLKVVSQLKNAITLRTLQNKMFLMRLNKRQGILLLPRACYFFPGKKRAPILAVDSPTFILKKELRSGTLLLYLLCSHSGEMENWFSHSFWGIIWENYICEVQHKEVHKQQRPTLCTTLIWETKTRSFQMLPTRWRHSKKLGFDIPLDAVISTKSNERRGS